MPVSSNVRLGCALDFFFQSVDFFFSFKQNLTWTPILYKMSRSGAGGSCTGESVMELGPPPTWSPPGLGVPGLSGSSDNTLKIMGLDNLSLAEQL